MNIFPSFLLFTCWNFQVEFLVWKMSLDSSEAVSMLLEGLGRSQVQEKFKFKGLMCPDNRLWKGDAVHNHRSKDLVK